MEQMEAKKTVRYLDPEFWRRFKALMEAGASVDVGVGVGTGWRIQPTNPDGSTKPGFAAPGNSNHEGFPANGVAGGAVAIDAVGDLAWMEKNLARYGLRSFIQPSTTGYKGSDEPWHVQPAEIPASRMRRTQPWTLAKFPLPGETVPLTALLGPDVSKWNLGIVPPTPPGIAFGIARASIGLTLDTTVGGPIKFCRNNKIPFCAYHFVFELNDHPAAAQADTFHRAVGGDTNIPCMLDWETGPKDYCHPTDGHEQHARWVDVIAVANAVRKLGHRCALVYTANWYWVEQGQPNMSGVGLDLINAQYGKEPWPFGTAAAIYETRGGDTGPGWTSLGGLTPVLWQYTCQATWGNQQVDFNAYRGKASDLGRWFTTWETSVPGTPPADLDKDDDMLFICKVGSTIYVGDGVRSSAVASGDVDTVKANVEGVGTSRWRHPARKDLPVLTKMADIPTINAGQRDCLVGKLD
jgi:hypothetical protein